jgi:ketosteroid isomerase-like protein
MYEDVALGEPDTRYFAEWLMAPLDTRGVSVGTLRDGKVASNRDYWNTGSLRRP